MNDDTLRLDKWLWAARFFKTRALASTAVSGGKVRCNGQRLKPARALRVGEYLEIRRGFERYEVQVLELDDRRGPASAASRLYQETESSIAERAAEAQKRELARLQRPVSEGRPDKKQRRQIRRFNEKP